MAAPLPEALGPTRLETPKHPETLQKHHTRKPPNSEIPIIVKTSRDPHSPTPPPRIPPQHHPNCKPPASNIIHQTPAIQSYYPQSHTRISPNSVLSIITGPNRKIKLNLYVLQCKALSLSNNSFPDYLTPSNSERRDITP